MNTILVPTDFSETAKNAALYAANLAKQLNAQKIILYNAYLQPVATDANMAPLELINFDELKNISQTGLNRFKELVSQVCEGLEIETLGEYITLTEGIKEVCKTNSVDVVIAGVTGGGPLEETLAGSHAVIVAKHVTVPVIVVPPGTIFTPIKKVVLACDFKKVAETTPVAALKRLLDETKAQLLVLNIDHEHKNATAETAGEKAALDGLLQGYSPEFHFVDSANFIEGVNNFAIEQSVDLIIVIPKKHNFFEGLFKRSHTTQLAFHSHVPLMSVHE